MEELTKEQQTAKNRTINPNKMSHSENIKYIDWLKCLGACQVCGESYNLDIPHHEPRGIYKDDRYRVNICIDCHRIRHGSKKGKQLLTNEEIKEIAIMNWMDYNSSPAPVFPIAKMTAVSELRTLKKKLDLLQKKMVEIGQKIDSEIIICSHIHAEDIQFSIFNTAISRRAELSVNSVKFSIDIETDDYIAAYAINAILDA